MTTRALGGLRVEVRRDPTEGETGGGWVGQVDRVHSKQ